VLCRDNKGEAPRLGLAISKKHCRKATARNRIKRVIRESFRQHQQELSGLDVVVINQPAAGMANAITMNESLEQHWKKCLSTKRNTTMQES